MWDGEFVVEGRVVAAGWGMEEEENDEEGRHRRGRQGSGAGDRGVWPGQPIVRRRRQWARRCCGQPAREVSWSLRKPPALDALPIPLIQLLHGRSCSLPHSTHHKGKLMRHGPGILFSSGILAEAADRIQTVQNTSTGGFNRSISLKRERRNIQFNGLTNRRPPRSPPAPCSSAFCADRH